MVKIPEFAETLKEVKTDLRGRYMTTCIEHLVKLAIFDSPQNVNHWRTEVYASYPYISKLKKDKKFPSYKLIFNTVWDHYGDILDNIIDTVTKKESKVKLKPNINIDKDVIVPIKHYITWLAEQLSKQGKIDKQECLEKLKEIGL